MHTMALSPVRTEPTALSAINRESLQSRAKDAIVQAILNGLFMPGERVIETKIAEGLKLSRSTVRAAIQALIQEGLLVQMQYCGTIVMPLTAVGAGELETMREALEGLAVRRAVEHATSDEIEELHRRYEAAYAAAGNNDIGLSYRLDLAIHQQLVTMAHHELLAFHFKLIEPKMLLYMAHAGGPFLSRASFERQHKDIVLGIARRDAELATRALNAHFAEATGFLVTLFADKEAQANDQPSDID